MQGVDDWPISRYHAICQQRDRYANELAALHARVDLLLLPTVPLCAFEAGRDVPQDQPGADWMSWNPYTPAFNSAQVPALSYPVWAQGAAGWRAMGRAQVPRGPPAGDGPLDGNALSVRIAPEQE